MSSGPSPSTSSKTMDPSRINGKSRRGGSNENSDEDPNVKRSRSDLMSPPGTSVHSGTTSGTDPNNNQGKSNMTICMAGLKFGEVTIEQGSIDMTFDIQGLQINCEQVAIKKGQSTPDGLVDRLINLPNSSVAELKVHQHRGVLAFRLTPPETLRLRDQLNTHHQAQNADWILRLKTKDPLTYVSLFELRDILSSRLKVTENITRPQSAPNPPPQPPTISSALTCSIIHLGQYSYIGRNTISLLKGSIALNLNVSKPLVQWEVPVQIIFPEEPPVKYYLTTLLRDGILRPLLFVDLYSKKQIGHFALKLENPDLPNLYNPCSNNHAKRYATFMFSSSTPQETQSIISRIKEALGSLCFEPSSDQIRKVLSTALDNDLRSMEPFPLAKSPQSLPKNPPQPFETFTTNEREPIVKFKCYAVRVGDYLACAIGTDAPGMISATFTERELTILGFAPQFRDKIPLNNGSDFKLSIKLSSINEIIIHPNNSRNNTWFFGLTKEEGFRLRQRFHVTAYGTFNFNPEEDLEYGNSKIKYFTLNSNRQSTIKQDIESIRGLLPGKVRITDGEMTSYLLGRENTLRPNAKLQLFCIGIHFGTWNYTGEPGFIRLMPESKSLLKICMMDDVGQNLREIYLPEDANLFFTLGLWNNPDGVSLLFLSIRIASFNEFKFTKFVWYLTKQIGVSTRDYEVDSVYEEKRDIILVIKTDEDVHQIMSRLKGILRGRCDDITKDDWRMLKQFGKHMGDGKESGGGRSKVEGSPTVEDLSVLDG